MSLVKISTFSERLKEALEDDDSIKITELASKIGMSKQAISSYTTNVRTPKRPVINAISEVLKVNPMWLLGYDVEKHLNINKKQGYKIPVLGKVQAGIPLEAVQDVIDEEEIDPAMALSGEYFALKIKGKSMEPRIYEGDVVIVKRQPDVESGQIAVVLVDGKDATVKIVEKHEDGIVLIALNPSVYSPHLYTNKHIEELPITILGRVVELRGKLE